MSSNEPSLGYAARQDRDLPVLRLVMQHQPVQFSLKKESRHTKGCTRRLDRLCHKESINSGPWTCRLHSSHYRVLLLEGR